MMTMMNFEKVRRLVQIDTECNVNRITDVELEGILEAIKFNFLILQMRKQRHREVK